MSFEVINPFAVFTDTDGTPLENGKLFIGVVNLNPKTNPVSVFFDDARQIPAAQPIRTIGGYPSRDGTPTDIFIAQNSHSITVDDKNDEFVFSDLGVVITEDSVLFFDTIADMTAILKSSLNDNQQISVGGYTTIGDGGGGTFSFAKNDNASVVDNGIIFATDEGGTGRWIRSVNGLLLAQAFNILGAGGDDTDAMLDFLKSDVKSLDFGDKTYLLTTWITHTLLKEKNFIGRATIDADGNASRFVKLHANVKSKDMIWKDWTLQVFGNLVADAAPSTVLKIIRGGFISCILPIDLEGATTGNMINKVDFIGCKGTVIRFGRNVFAEQDNWINNRVMNCDFIDTVSHPTSTTTDTRNILMNGKDGHITNNTMDTITGQSTSETHAIFTKARDTVIAGNTIKNVTIGSTISAINIKGSAKGITVTPQGFGCNVNGNIIDVADAGIRVRCSDTLVISNNIRNVKLGIEAGTAENDRSSYIGNSLFGTGVVGSIGIDAGVVNEAIVANDNTVDGFVISIRVGSRGAISSKNVSVKGNKIIDTTTAIQIFPSVGIPLTDVTITDNSVTDAATLIRFETGGILNDVTIKGNTGTNVTTYLSSTGLAAFPKSIDYEQLFTIQTTDAVLNTALSVTTQDGSAYILESDVIAGESAGADRATYKKRMLTFTTGGTATIQGTLVTLTPDIESAGAVPWTSDLAVGGDDIRMRVLGAAATTINWKVNLTIKGAA